MSGQTKGDSKCRRSAKAAIGRALKAAADKGGEILYTQTAAVYNAFIDTLKAAVRLVVAIMEPIITLDVFVFNTFVKPPLTAVKSLAKTVQRTIVVPSQMTGAAGNGCKKESENKKAVDRVVRYMTQDLPALVNKLDKLEYTGLVSADVLSAMKNLPDSVDGMKLPPYNEFKAWLDAI